MQEKEEQLEENAPALESEDLVQDPEPQQDDLPQAETEEVPAAEDVIEEAAVEEPETVAPEAPEEELAPEAEQAVPEAEEREEEEAAEEEPEAADPSPAAEEELVPEAEEEEVPEGEVEVSEPEAEVEEDSEEIDDRYLTASPGEKALREPVKDDGRAWYVIHCYSGNEDKVRHNILQRIESMSMDNLIFDVVVPTEDEVNIKNGERQTVEKKVFPGYILVNMILTEESWYMVRNTPGVTGFVGMGNDPTALQPEEVARILKRMESESPRINVTFRTGERVRIVDGPFEDFYGKVAEIDMERATVRVMVNFFGRETPVELDFLQVEEA